MNYKKCPRTLSALELLLSPQGAMRLLLVFLACVVIVAFAQVPSGEEEEKMVLLTDVPFLIFRAGEMTVRKFNPNVPTLECSGSCQETPSEIMCMNRGSSMGEAQWACLPKENDRFKLGGIAVVCEGARWERQRHHYYYRASSGSPPDRYTFLKSCSLQYSLLTPEEAARRPLPSNATTRMPLAVIILLALFGYVAVMVTGFLVWKLTMSRTNELDYPLPRLDDRYGPLYAPPRDNSQAYYYATSPSEPRERVVVVERDSGSGDYFWGYMMGNLMASSRHSSSNNSSGGGGGSRGGFGGGGSSAGWGTGGTKMI